MPEPPRDLPSPAGAAEPTCLSPRRAGSRRAQTRPRGHRPRGHGPRRLPCSEPGVGPWAPPTAPWLTAWCPQPLPATPWPPWLPPSSGQRGHLACLCVAPAPSCAAAPVTTWPRGLLGHDPTPTLPSRPRSYTHAPIHYCPAWTPASQEAMCPCVSCVPLPGQGLGPIHCPRVSADGDTQ